MFNFILQLTITVMLDDFDSPHTTCVIPIITYEDAFTVSGATDFESVSQKTATIVYGMFFHLIGDIYAHRTVVPPQSIAVTNKTSHGNSSDVFGGNDGLYFVKNDFSENCYNHIVVENDSVKKEYRKMLEGLWYNVINSYGLKFFPAIYKFVKFVFEGKDELREKYKLILEDEQREKDLQLLTQAMNIPSNARNGRMCYQNCACYGALIRLAGLGVLQFKDIKYFLTGYNKDVSLQTQKYKENQKYYEDKALGNEFYKRRYLAAKAVTRQYFKDYYASVKGGEIRQFLPYYLLPLSQESGTNIKHFCLKLDQYYNYLIELDLGSAVLKSSTWSNTGYSLFNFTTIVYNGNYFIDPLTYPLENRPRYYSSVFPSGTGKTSNDFYMN